MNLPDLNLFRRNFVSLVITSSRVMVTKLDHNLKKVEVSAQKNIPPGVIMGYRVSEKAQLAETIKALWKENKIKDKFVGVVVPEFATYTKTVDLPNLTDTEIDEALNWQIQDLLPAPLEELIVDWKIIDRKPQEIKILVVSILKEVLMGYIDVVGQAGLSPLVVETPSLSVERITKDEENNGKLVIYINRPEALLVITKGPQIVASSVVSSDNLNIVVSTALQMMSHYKGSEVSKVLVSGVGITQDLISHLNYNLGKPVSFFNRKFVGLADPQSQDYLLGLSLQMKDPAEPSSEKTINLLPVEWAQKYKQELQYIKTWTMTLIISIITWATFLLSLTVFTLLSFQVEDLKRQGVTGAMAGFNVTVSEVQSINKDIEKFVSIKKSFTPFAEPINTLSKFKNENVLVNNYKFNLETGTVSIIGISSDASSLIDYKNTI